MCRGLTAALGKKSGMPPIPPSDHGSSTLRTQVVRTRHSCCRWQGLAPGSASQVHSPLATAASAHTCMQPNQHSRQTTPAGTRMGSPWSTDDLVRSPHMTVLGGRGLPQRPLPADRRRLFQQRLSRRTGSRPAGRSRPRLGRGPLSSPRSSRQLRPGRLSGSAG